MDRVTWIATILLTVFALAPVASAQRAAPETSRASARSGAIEKRREWLRAALSRNMHDATQLADVNAKLKRMSPDQIDELSARYLAELNQRRRHANEARAATRRQRGEALEAAPPRVAADGRHGARPGFVPVITWLPEGASLTASAVVSPDGRYVRIRAIPFFSTIGPVHTFNFYTGETRLLYPGPPDPFGHPRPRPRIWHDGLRTRVGR